MCGLYKTSEVHCHVRSISLPSRLHPASQKIEIELEKLKTWDSSVSSTSADSALQAENIKTGLRGLTELYNCIHQFLDSPVTQQLLHHHQEERHLEKALDMSVGLLDVCGSARELLLLTKEHVQDMQSVLRRKGLDSSIRTQINAYVCFRRKARKEISKNLKSLKTMESSFIKSFSYPLLKELNCITISFFRKILSFMLKKSTCGWSLISRMVFNGYGRQKWIIDIALCNFHTRIRKSEGEADLQVVKRRLQEIDGSIRDLEAHLDRLFRCLIQHRVSLLNLLTP